MVITSILLIGGSFAAFAILHSLTAGAVVRDRLAGVFNAPVIHGVYRLAYNVVSVLIFLLPLALVALLPDTTVYQAKPPISFVLIAIQLIGASGVVIALLQTDLLSFAGLRQLVVLLSGGDPADERPRLQTGGFYRWTRHPLYVFSLLAIWPLPVMTFNILIFNISATLYFAFGSIVEERRLENVFGDEYREYKKRVGWLGAK